MNRRHFLSSIGSVGILPWLSNGLRAAPLLGGNGGHAAASGPNDVIVAIQFGGGIDMLSAWVPYGVPEYAARRGGIGYVAPGTTGVAPERVCLPAENGIGFGPGLAEVKALYDRGDLAVVQKVGYPNPSRSHFTSLQIWRYGQRDLTTAVTDGRGWLARTADDIIATPSAVVGINTPNFPEYASRDGRVVLLESVDTLVAGSDNPELMLAQRAVDTIATRPDQTASDPIRDTMRRTAELRQGLVSNLAGYDGSEAYPDTRFGTSLRETARMVSASPQSRAFFVTRRGPSVDTHSDQLNRMVRIQAETDAALGAFVRDLQRNGTWNRVTIVLFSEFGRTLDRNGSNGTDHGHGNHMFVIGNAVQGGPKGNAVTSADLSSNNRFLPIEIDFREVFQEIAMQRLGVDLTQGGFVEPFNTTPGGLGLF